MDANGLLYVLSNNGAIRKVSADGTVTTLAGGPGGWQNTGSADGFGRDARFNNPQGIAVSSSGVIYVADSQNYTIRTITPQGMVTTLSGAVGVDKSVDGPVSAARFVSPRRMAADASGNVFVLDGFATIRKITPDGNVSTLAGKAGEWGFVDGVGTEARFNGLVAITATPEGTLFVMDNGCVRKITPEGRVTTVAGGYPAQYPPDSFPFDGKGSQARFRYAKGITMDSNGTLFVVDEKVRRVSADMTVTTLPAGTLFARGDTPDDDGTPPAIGANDMAIDSHGNIYRAEFFYGCVRKVTPDGVISTLRPMDVRPSDGRKIPASIYPACVAVDSKGDIYLAESSAIGKIAADGVIRVFAGDRIYSGIVDGVGRDARFRGVQRMVFDREDNLYVADTDNYLIRKVTPQAVVTTLAGSPVNWPFNSGTADGKGAEARFAHPEGIAVDNSGNVYVADTHYIAFGHTIRKITPDGVVTTLAGLAGADGAIDGTGSAARFHHPTGVTTDSRGNIYVADAWNYLLRKITPAGVVTTLAGGNPNSFDADGVGSAAGFASMKGLTADSAGNIYLSDSGRLRIATSTLKARSLNVSTRLQVLDGENVLIGGFIIGGTNMKKVIVRALGPSLAANAVTGVLSDPAMELYDGSGRLIASNDNWKINSQTHQSQEAAIVATTIPPSDDREAAIATTLDPEEAYTVVVHGSHGEKGVSIVEVYDLNSTNAAALLNISTRGFVESGDKVMIGGFILGGNNGKGEVVVRALGPSLAQSQITNPLADPSLELFDANGQVIASNDDWNDMNEGAIQSSGLQPPNSLESAIRIVLPAGAYTALVGGHGKPGVGLLEVYNLP
jgi:sugar lactone lactonase YvrE